jgi:hypothetical protein
MAKWEARLDTVSIIKNDIEASPALAFCHELFKVLFGEVYPAAIFIVDVLQMITSGAIDSVNYPVVPFSSEHLAYTNVKIDKFREYCHSLLYETRQFFQRDQSLFSIYIETIGNSIFAFIFALPQPD